jgi:hypothetical protein
MTNSIMMPGIKHFLESWLIVLVLGENEFIVLAVLRIKLLKGLDEVYFITVFI